MSYQMILYTPTRTHFILGLALSACAFAGGDAGHVTIRNASGETVQQATITVSDSTLAIENIPPGGTRSLHYRLGRESGYRVVAVLESGKKLQMVAGYVAAGLRTDDVFEIRADEIVDVTPRREPHQRSADTSAPASS